MAKSWHTIPGSYYEYRWKYETFYLNTRRYVSHPECFWSGLSILATSSPGMSPCMSPRMSTALETWIRLHTILVIYYEYLWMYVTFDLTTRRYCFVLPLNPSCASGLSILFALGWPCQQGLAVTGHVSRHVSSLSRGRPSIIAA